MVGRCAPRQGGIGPAYRLKDFKAPRRVVVARSVRQLDIFEARSVVKLDVVAALAVVPTKLALPRRYSALDEAVRPVQQPHAPSNQR